MKEALRSTILAVMEVRTEVPTNLANMALLGYQLRQVIFVKCAPKVMREIEGAGSEPPKVLKSSRAWS